MANIGLKKFLYAPLSETDDTKYSAAPEVLAGAIECKVALDLNSAALYADDNLSDEDTSISKGTITLGIDNDDEEKFAALLGKKVVEKQLAGEPQVSYKLIESSTTDEPIACGFGYISTKRADKKTKYKVKFYKKVKFRPFETDDKTKGEKLEFTTPSVEGTVYPISDGTLKFEAVLDKLDDAVAVLESLFVQET